MITAQANDPQAVSTLKIRALQTRIYKNTNKEQALMAALAAFQDLGFITNESSKQLGLIKADQIHPNENSVIQATFTLTPDTKDNETLVARLSLSQSDLFSGEEGTNLAGQLPRSSESIKTPITYQQFFNAFSYALHLERNS